MLVGKEIYILRRPRFRFNLNAYVCSKLNIVLLQTYNHSECLIITTKQIIKKLVNR